MAEILKQIENGSRLRWKRINGYTPRVRLLFQQGHYIVKTADRFEELKQCFRLRNEVFNKEFRGVDYGYDIDRFDSVFDHLLIIDKRTEQIVGTYRMRCFDELKNSYAALEFDLSRIVKSPGPTLELGRACISKNHRKGALISLLWRGIWEYMKESQANTLFGCSSIKVDNPRDAALIYQSFLERGLVREKFFSRPRKDFYMQDLQTWRRYFELNYSAALRAEAEALTPPLLNSYLKYGATIAGEPAFDADFNCIDFLTVLTKDSLSQSLVKKYATKLSS